MMKKLKSLMCLLLVLVMSIGMVSTASAAGYSDTVTEGANQVYYDIDKTRVKVGETVVFSGGLGTTHYHDGYLYGIGIYHIDEEGNETTLFWKSSLYEDNWLGVSFNKPITPSKPGVVYAEIEIMHNCDYCRDKLTRVTTEMVEVWSDECRHKTTEWIETTPADCTNEGVKSLTCSNCGKVVDTAAIPVNDQHTEGTPTEAVAPTCTEEGEETISCTLCGKLLKTNPIPALGHTTDEGTVTLEPTCTEDGVRTYTCTVCGEEQKTEIVPALGHNSDNAVVSKEPTCTEDGVRSYTCTVCGEEQENEVIPALGHTTDEGTVTLEPTCTEDGVRSYTCTVCGEEQENEVIPALGHTMDEGTVTLEPTCTETGLRSYTCTVCGEAIEDEEVPALGHTADEGTVTLEPTCTETGLKAHVCTVCGAELEDSTVEALGHDKGKWIITIPVTENTDGERELHCTRCDALLKTETIPYAVYYWMNACSIGPHFRDVSDVTDKWYMFTPIDLSVNGVQTYDMIGGDMHVIGKIHVLVENGEVTVTYELVNKRIEVKSEFLTFFGSLDDVSTVEPMELTGYAFGEPISIANELDGDTKVLLYIRNGVVYDAMGAGIRGFYHRNKEYLQYVEELKLLMD